MNYFAFGANLDPAVLFRRRMNVRAQQEFLLRDYELTFTQQGPFKGGGFASLDHAPGKVTYGHILQLGRVDAIRMDFSELVPIFKRHRRVTVTQDGITFFFYQATEPVAGLIPTAEYRQKIVQAAEKSSIIPPDLLESLRATPALETLERDENLSLFFNDIAAWPTALQPALRFYNNLCLQFFILTVRRSLFAPLIRVTQL